MPDLIQLKQQLLTHNLQCAHFLSFLMLSQEYLAISALADLRQNLEISLPQSSATLP